MVGASLIDEDHFSRFGALLPAVEPVIGLGALGRTDNQATPDAVQIEFASGMAWAAETALPKATSGCSLGRSP